MFDRLPVVSRLGVNVVWRLPLVLKLCHHRSMQSMYCARFFNIHERTLHNFSRRPWPTLISSWSAHRNTFEASESRTWPWRKAEAPRVLRSQPRSSPPQCRIAHGLLHNNCDNCGWLMTELAAWSRVMSAGSGWNLERFSSCCSDTWKRRAFPSMWTRICVNSQTDGPTCRCSRAKELPSFSLPRRPPPKVTS